MTTQLLTGVITGNFAFNADCIIHCPTSGFQFTFNAGVSDTPVFGFSGMSGALFDWSGDFVGGYQSGAPFSISGAGFAEDPRRVSYSINDVPIKNNIYCPFVDLYSVSFEGYGVSTMDLETAEIIPNDKDVTYFNLYSSEGTLLLGSGGEILVSFA